MTLPISPPVAPMLAKLEEDIPSGEGWVYEPKWDGFRALIFRDGDAVRIESRNGQPLARYFPELVLELGRALPERCVIDGEIVIASTRGLDFDALLQRVHPAASRIQRLAHETPSSFVAFDLLAEGDEDLRGVPFDERRRRLEQALRPSDRVHVTPQTDELRKAKKWFTQFEGAGLDGVIAKRIELPYVEGERVMVKVKHRRTCECVVGGFRPAKTGGVGSLLLGLYDEAGVLQYVGSTSAFKAKERREFLALLEPLVGGQSFGEGRAPGGPSRWNRGKETSWTAVTPTLVCEVAFDHLQGDRFRHAAQFLKWRADKAPTECTFAQLRPARPFKLEQALHPA